MTYYVLACAVLCGIGAGVELRDGDHGAFWTCIVMAATCGLSVAFKLSEVCP